MGRLGRDFTKQQKYPKRWGAADLVVFGPCRRRAWACGTHATWIHIRACRGDSRKALGGGLFGARRKFFWCPLGVIGDALVASGRLLRASRGGMLDLSVRAPFLAFAQGARHVRSASGPGLLPGPFSGPLESHWGLLGPSWRPLEVLIGRHWALGDSLAILERSEPENVITLTPVRHKINDVCLGGPSLEEILRLFRGLLGALPRVEAILGVWKRSGPTSGHWLAVLGASWGSFSPCPLRPFWGPHCSGKTVGGDRNRAGSSSAQEPPEFVGGAPPTVFLMPERLQEI